MNKKILLVEDEPTLQKTIGEVLKKENYEVFSALDGKTGLDLVQKEKPDLILLDLILPKMNGFEVLEELKSKEETKNIPVIILTNLERNEDINRALELGATTYLVKANYDLKDVIKKVEQVFNQNNL